MKFLFSRDIRDQAHIRLSLIFFLFAILCFWALNWPYEASCFGLFPTDIQIKILGDIESFAPAMSLDSLLLNIHIRLFLYTISLLTIASIYFRLPTKTNIQVTMISAAYSLVLFNMISVILIRYMSPSFIWLKFFSFWGFQMVFGWMTFHTLIFLLSRKKAKAHHVAH